MYVKTDYDGCEYITAGKAYEFFDGEDEFSPYIKCDRGMSMLIPTMDRIKCGCSAVHLDDIGTWTICDENGEEL